MRHRGLWLLLVAGALFAPSAHAGSGVAAPVTDDFPRGLVSLVVDEDPDDGQADDPEADEEIEVIGTSVDEDVVEDPCDSPDSSVAVLLNCIRAGTWSERLLAVEWLPDALGVFDAGPAVDQKTLDDAIDLLIQIVHDEPDDWIARSLLEVLDAEDGAGIARLFRAALREASINVRAMAVRHLEFEEDPEALDDLESLWRSVLPDWLRRSLIVALAEQPLAEPARRTYLNEFIGLTTHADPEIRLAAIEALGPLGDADAEPALLRAARHGTPVERAAALGSLALLPVDDATMAELERALHAEDPGVRRSAIRALDGLSHPEADPLLIKVLEQSTDVSDLAGAVDGLERSNHPEATAAIAAALGRVEPGNSAWVMERMVMVLQNRDDVDALPWLGNLSPGIREALGKKLTDLVTYLSRDRATDRKIIMTSTACGGGHRESDPGDPRARRIAPESPFETVRCREAPSVAGESWTTVRPGAGSLVMIEEYFERPGETWVQVHGESIDCWVPLAELVAADTPPPAPDPTRRPRFEFDLPSREASSAEARALIEAGLLEILETDAEGDIAAAALTVDPDDPDQVALLQPGSAGRRGVLDQAIDRFRRACCGPLP